MGGEERPLLPQGRGRECSGEGKKDAEVEGNR